MQAFWPCLRNFDFALHWPPPDAEDEAKAEDKVREKKAKKEKEEKKKDKKNKKKDKKDKKEKEKEPKSKKDHRHKRKACCHFEHRALSPPDFWSGTGGCASSCGDFGCYSWRVAALGPHENFEIHET